jgi:hypothetical protein
VPGIVFVDSLDGMRAALRARLPEFLSGENREIVAQLLSVPLSDPLSKTFNPDTAAGAIFPGGSFFLSPDCRRRATPAGEADQGDCVATNGQDAGRGAFIRLTYSKNMGLGNIKFLKRGAVPDTVTPDMLPKATLSDADALQMATAFMFKFFGLPPGEVPLPPAGAKGSPVRSLALAGADETGARMAPQVVQKLVTLQRGFPLAKSIPTPGGELTHVPGPGTAVVGVDNTGVVAAAVTGWHELRRDPNITADRAKPGTRLIDEIAEDLFNEGVRQLSGIHFHVVIASDWRGSHGLVLPAVRVGLAPVPRDPTEEQQRSFAGLSTAGLIKEYSLVERVNVESR